MITHDELIYCLQQQYPDAVHGRDFWVGQDVSRDTGKQLSDATIREWKLDAPLPSRRALQALIREHGAAARRSVIERAARDERERRLKVADTLVYKAMDAGDLDKMRAAGQYRQELRDVPELPGFPEAFAWPSIPGGLAAQS